MSQRVKTSARELVFTRSSQPENGHLRKNTEGQSKMERPEKLVTQSTQDEDKQTKNTTQYVLDTTMCKQTHTM